MQTERVTFLTSPDHKAALDAFARQSGKSIGHVMREASAHYIASQNSQADEDEEAFNFALTEIEAVLKTWPAKFDSMERSIDEARAAIAKAIADVDASK
jgi:predicted transcriptional regulator